MQLVEAREASLFRPAIKLRVNDERCQEMRACTSEKVKLVVPAPNSISMLSDLHSTRNQHLQRTQWRQT